MLRLGMLLVLVPAYVAAEGGAFCELTPCVPGKVTRTTLAADQPVGKVLCKKGQEIGHDDQKRVVFCTTAKPVTIDGIEIAADKYTLFHPNGRVYQTHVRTPFERVLKDGSKVSCAVELIALEDDGGLRYCKLAAKRTGKPQARVGEGISFHRDGRVAGMTLDEPYAAAGLALVAGNSVVWDPNGRLIGGYSSDEIAAGSLAIHYDFQIHPNGKLALVELAKPAKVGGHDFPLRAKLKFRDDGTLEAAQYISKQGFMIHGEPWRDTTTQTFDRTGKITSSNVEHYQAKDPPPKFRPKQP